MAHSLLTQPNTPADPILSTLLLPLQASHLLVPNVSMAELVGHQLPQRPEQELPNWIQGFVQWRGESVPLVLYENFIGNRRGAEAPDLRIAIMNSINPAFAGGFFGILIQGIPRMLKLRAEELEQITDAELKGAQFVVDTPLGRAAIPDLDALELALAKALPRQ